MKTPYLNAYIAAMEMVKESGNMDEDFEPVLNEFIKVRSEIKRLKPKSLPCDWCSKNGFTVDKNGARATYCEYCNNKAR